MLGSQEQHPSLPTHLIHLIHLITFQPEHIPNNHPAAQHTTTTQRTRQTLTSIARTLLKLDQSDQPNSSTASSHQFALAECQA